MYLRAKTKISAGLVTLSRTCPSMVPLVYLMVIMEVGPQACGQHMNPAIMANTKNEDKLYRVVKTLRKTPVIVVIPSFMN